MQLITNPKTMATSEWIEQLSYPDFVAFLRQKNTPPGGEDTIRAWIEHAQIRCSSYILDLACTTGFSSRTVARLTGCSSAGIDICESAITEANQELAMESSNLRLTYQVANACCLPFADQMFTHILGGCNFGFIQKREIALAECQRVLQKDGKLCIANFYYHTPPTTQLFADVERVVGFQPQKEWTTVFWNQFFAKYFRLVSETHHDLPVLTKEMIDTTIHRQIFENPALAECSPNVREACYRRLLDTRQVLNQHRAFQRYTIQIWEKV